MKSNKDYITIELYVGEIKVGIFDISREQLKQDFDLDLDNIDDYDLGSVYEYCWGFLEPDFYGDYEIHKESDK